MTPNHDAPAGSEEVPSSGRRNAMRSLAGIGAASMALIGPAGPGVLGVEAAKKKKKGKRGPTGPTGPAGAVGALVREVDEVQIGDGGTESGQANCPSGEATGGGAGISNAGCAVISNGPVGTDAWGATGKCPGGQTATLFVTVICVE